MKSEEGRKKTSITELRRESALIYCVMVYACPYMYNFYKLLAS